MSEKRPLSGILVFPVMLYNLTSYLFLSITTTIFINIFICITIVTISSRMIIFVIFIYIKFKKQLLKACYRCFFFQIFIFSPSERSSKILKNVFYFMEKSLFVLEIFRYLYVFSFLSTILRFKRTNGSRIIYDARNWLA